MTKYLGTPVTSTGTPGSYSLTVPTGVATWMTGLIAMGSPNSTAYTITTTGSAGTPTFTAIDARAAGNMYVRVLKVTGVKAGDTITITPSAGTSLEIGHYYDDTVDFTAASVSAAVRGSSVSTCTTGSLTPASSQKVEIVSLERTTATPTTVSSVTSSGSETVTQTSYDEATGNPAVSVYFGEFTASAAAARTATVTYSGGSGNGYAAAVLTSPISAPNPGVPIHYTSATDTLSTAHAYYTSATDTLATPLEVRPFPFGYASVSAFLAAASTSTPVYVAHRGGSIDWPEMTLYAYTQAGYWGCGALEVSLAQTRDGVYFGLHDSTLNRTSGSAVANTRASGTTASSPTVTDSAVTALDQGRAVTGTGIPASTFVGTVTPGVSYLLSSSATTQSNVNATATGSPTLTLTYSTDPTVLTWAQIQAVYSVSASLPSGQTAKPYMRLEDIVSAYGSSHVLFIDPKLIFSVGPLFTLLGTLYTALGLTLGDRVVIKYYGVSATTVPSAAQALGMKTWGYFYQADSANFATYADSRWDILGLDYTADATTWSTFMGIASTKPVLAHICPDAAAVTTGTGRGAVGAIVSGVKEAITRV
jgi:hypothetical protein